jgi:hypothetical protein
MTTKAQVQFHTIRYRRADGRTAGACNARSLSRFVFCTQVALFVSRLLFAISYFAISVSLASVQSQELMFLQSCICH